MNTLQRVTAILEQARIAGGWIDSDVAKAILSELGINDDGKPIDSPAAQPPERELE